MEKLCNLHFAIRIGSHLKSQETPKRPKQPRFFPCQLCQPAPAAAFSQATISTLKRIQIYRHDSLKVRLCARTVRHYVTRRQRPSTPTPYVMRYRALSRRRWIVPLFTERISLDIWNAQRRRLACSGVLRASFGGQTRALALFPRPHWLRMSVLEGLLKGSDAELMEDQGKVVHSLWNLKARARILRQLSSMFCLSSCRGAESQSLHQDAAREQCDVVVPTHIAAVLRACKMMWTPFK